MSSTYSSYNSQKGKVNFSNIWIFIYLRICMDVYRIRDKRRKSQRGTTISLISSHISQIITLKDRTITIDFLLFFPLAGNNVRLTTRFGIYSIF